MIGLSNKDDHSTSTIDSEETKTSLPVEFRFSSQSSPPETQKHPKSPPPSQITPVRRFIRGVRHIQNLDFSHLDWVKNEEDLSILKTVIKTAYRCSMIENTSIYDVEVYDDTKSEDCETVEGQGYMCMLFRVVVSLSGNVPVNKKTLDTIEHCAPTRISSMGIVTVIEYPDMFELQKKESIQQAIQDKTTTQIVIYIQSENHHKKVQQLQKSKLLQSFRPDEGMQHIGKKRKH